MGKQLILASLLIAAMLPSIIPSLVTAALSNRSSLCVLKAPVKTSELQRCYLDRVRVEAFESEPWRGRLQYLIAAKALAGNDPVAAISMLETLSRIQRLEPLVLARAHWEIGHEARALSLLDQFYPGTRWDFIASAVDASLIAGDVMEAVSLLDTVLKEDLASTSLKDRERSYASAYLAYFHAQRYQDAERYSEILVSLFPESSRYWGWLGAAQLQLNKVEHARESLKAAVDLHGNAPNRFTYGAALLAHGDRVAAKEQFEQALSLDPQYHPARLDLARLLYMQSDYALAISHLEFVIANAQEGHFATDAQRLLEEWKVSE